MIKSSSKKNKASLFLCNTFSNFANITTIKTILQTIRNPSSDYRSMN